MPPQGECEEEEAHWEDDVSQVVCLFVSLSLINFQVWRLFGILSAQEVSIPFMR